MSKIKHPLVSMITSAHELRIYLVKLNKEIPHKTFAAGADAIRNAFMAASAKKPATTTASTPAKTETPSASLPPPAATTSTTPSESSLTTPSTEE